mgnify:FL=1
MIARTADVKKFKKEPRFCAWCHKLITDPEQAEFIQTKRGQLLYIHTGCAIMAMSPRRINV